MRLSGLHLLLTYQCTLECDHCFIWGSPWQRGTMTLATVDEILRQARDVGTVESIYFEGGEPFLYYATLLAGVQAAHAVGFRVGVVSNGYWATSVADAVQWLRPFAGLLSDLSVSSDQYHYDEQLSQQAHNARQAADRLGIPIGLISIAAPTAADAVGGVGQVPTGESGVMFRGRAAEKLSGSAALQPWSRFTACPYEDLREPGRLHVDPFGNLQVCQGLVIGNLFEAPLKDLCHQYDPDVHAIVGPLLHGGPAALVEHYHLPHAPAYADACHLCDEARSALRGRFPALLAPDQAYGVAAG